MGALGADPDQLRDAAAAMRAEGRRIGDSIRQVTASLRGTRWIGRDADRFAAVWTRQVVLVRAAGEQLDQAAGELERNAAEQVRASARTGTAPIPARAVHPATTVADRTSGSWRWAHPGDLGASPASMNSTASDPGAPPFGEPLPLRTEHWELGGALASGIGVAGSARLWISEMPGGTSMVWLEDVDTATAAGGASLDLGIDHGAGIEVGVDAEVRAGLGTRHAWRVDSGEIPGLFTRLGIRELVGSGTISPGVPGQVGGGLAPVLEKVTDWLGVSAPEPDISDHLIMVDASAESAAGVAIAAFGISGAVANSVGVRERSDGTSLLVGLSGSYRTKGTDGGPSGARTAEVEVPLGGTGERHVVVTTSDAIDGGELTERRVYTLDGARAAELARDAATAVTTGDVEGATEALEALWNEVGVEPTWEDAVGGVLDNDVRTLDVGAALGPDLGGSVTAGRRVVTYSR